MKTYAEIRMRDAFAALDVATDELRAHNNDGSPAMWKALEKRQAAWERYYDAFVAFYGYAPRDTFDASFRA